MCQYGERIVPENPDWDLVIERPNPWVNEEKDIWDPFETKK